MTKDFFKSYTEFINEAFPDATIESHMKKLKKEADEFLKNRRTSSSMWIVYWWYWRGRIVRGSTFPI